MQRSLPSLMQVATGQLQDDFVGGLIDGAAAIGDLSNMWTELSKVAPSEIKADTEAVAEYWQDQYESAAKGVDDPLGAIAGGLLGGFQAVGPLTRVDQFVRENCDAG